MTTTGWVYALEQGKDLDKILLGGKVALGAGATMSCSSGFHSGAGRALKPVAARTS